MTQPKSQARARPGAEKLFCTTGGSILIVAMAHTTFDATNVGISVALS